MIPIGKLTGNPANPKKAFSARHQKGLRASLKQYGFAGCFVVAADPDGTYEILNGNSRVEELRAAGVTEVPAVVYENMPGEERTKFVLAYDKHAKPFDEKLVIAQLRELAEKGEDVRHLADLTAEENLARRLANQSARANATVMAAAAKMDSLILHGPAEDIAAIRDLIKTIRGQVNQSGRVVAALTQIKNHLDFTDEQWVTILLATMARFCSEL